MYPNFNSRDLEGFVDIYMKLTAGYIFFYVK